MWWLIADGVTLSSSAARLKLPYREAASKATNALSGGILGRCDDPVEGLLSLLRWHSS